MLIVSNKDVNIIIIKSIIIYARASCSHDDHRHILYCVSLNIYTPINHFLILRKTELYCLLNREWTTEAF